MRAKTQKSVIIVVLIVCVIGGVFAGGRTETSEMKEITVGSKIDTEGALLGSMIVRILREHGFSVVDRTQTGSTPIVRSAITNGEIDIYPEYTGNAFYFFPGESEADLWKQFQAGYEKASELDLAANDIVWLTPAPANNTWAIAIRADLSDSAQLRTLEDLAGYINAGNHFKLAASEEFVSSEAALPSFESSYGFSLTDDQLLVFAGGNTTLTEQAAASGREQVNAAMAYGTDGQLAALGLIVLEDTLNVQPVYAPAPIIRKEMLDTYPEIAAILEPVFTGLDMETLQLLNSRIAVEGQSAAAVAERYLEQQGLL
ncbi:MAG TPA: ABC transporter substrate-binding protein [Sphaerochaetaceae bacterium]|nr:ABC transporter substrate-binding protein [Sphaerochaetaceae bacterium]